MSNSDKEILTMYTKLNKCFHLYGYLTDCFSKKQYFDYDLFGCHGFLETFFKTCCDGLIEVNYLDIDHCIVVKKVYIDTQLLMLNPEVLLKIRILHMSLYENSIEGSYYLSGDKNHWFIFYDAQSDTGVLMTESEVIFDLMADYLYSP